MPDTREAMERRYDAIVVGTGPGGATVARELVRQGARVLLLERGPRAPARGTLAQFAREALVPGRSLLFTPQLLGMVRGLTVGGSSQFYYATAFPVPLDALRRHGVDLTDAVAEARAELPIAPLSQEMMTPVARAILEAGRAEGLDWRPLDKLMHQDRWRPGTPFDYFGAPSRVKWTARAWVDEAVAQPGGGATLLDRALALRVSIEGRPRPGDAGAGARAGRAVGVVFRRGGQTYEARADRVIVSAGGIGSPVLLRRSGLEGVGRDFFFDPLVSVVGAVDGLETRPDEIPMSAGVHLTGAEAGARPGEEGGGIMLTDMALPRSLDRLFAAQVLRLGRAAFPGHPVRIMVKIRDDLGGHLTRRGGVRKRLTQGDLARLAAGARRAREVLRRMGARGVYQTWKLAAHPGGTVKLGEHLDARLETRVTNLHVCDCSALPEPWGLPPTLTLVALGKYLARRLAAG